MPLMPSRDFGAQFFSSTNRTLSIHDHLFPSANTGIAHLRGHAPTVARHQAFLRGSVRVDIFGLRDGGSITGELLAPLRPRLPKLRPGHTYLLEVVLRTLTVGHHFTQGTTDSNEVWVDAHVHDGQRTLGRSGALGEHGRVDPWAHFVNVYMLDRHGQRIDRRNAQDIFTPLYDHQIPPGAAQVVHYLFTVPPDQKAPLTLEVRLNYRKFDTTYLQYVFGPNYSNSLPITVIAEDMLTLPIEGGPEAPAPPPSTIPEWQRWNDYGIGLLLEGNKGSEKGQLLQAEQAFLQVERLGRPDGPLNLARVYLKEGRLEEAAQALQRAARFQPPPPRWTLAWLSGLANKQNGHLDAAIADFRGILEDRYPELERRGFDFSKDYEVLNELGQTLFERAKQERHQPQVRQAFLREAERRFLETLRLDPENLAAHYNLHLIYQALDNPAAAQHHKILHERYRPDDNARDRAVTIARKANPAADHAAQATVIYDLQRATRPHAAASARLTSNP
jgi:tetratricopeptide (TPR) repeat protein